MATIHPTTATAQPSPTTNNQGHQEIKSKTLLSLPTLAAETLLFQPVDSSSSCSPLPVFNIDPSQVQSFLPPKSCLSSLLNVVCNNPFENGFDLGCDPGFLAPLQGTQSSGSPVCLVLANRGTGVLDCCLWPRTAVLSVAVSVRLVLEVSKVLLIICF
uniref:Uncharacterized protein n=1 Tax=Nelumbo nucifera TaxID=4432 RepID=A0A822YT05_NELNU|nr:TPA_asm: hypothetical protein HUJ06_005331 [Nelumbo nucifera]